MALFPMIGMFGIIIGIILMFGIGLSFLIGGGWAFMIIDFVFQSGTGGYENLQKSFPPKKGLWGKVIGVFFVFLSIVTAFFILPLFI
ncbi:MAG: hypothetical protein Q7S61_02270 [bacterium]|nr:hypothetical protein [bacterium]